MHIQNLMNDGNGLAADDRRSILKRILAVGSAPILYTVLPFSTALVHATAGSLVDTDLAKAFMARAMEMKRIAVEAGDQPYGAIVVKGKEIVGEGPSRVITNHDPTAHAEVEAIRHAARRLGTHDLSGCVMYGTSRACRMCETAAYWANISRLV
jgi:hypothetical protein